MKVIFAAAICLAGLMLWLTRKLKGARAPSSPQASWRQGYDVPLSASTHASCAPSRPQTTAKRHGNRSLLGKLLHRAAHPAPGTGMQLQPQHPIRVGGRRHDHIIEPGEAKPTIVGRVPNQ